MMRMRRGPVLMPACPISLRECPYDTSITPITPTPLCTYLVPSSPQPSSHAPHMILACAFVVIRFWTFLIGLIRITRSTMRNLSEGEKRFLSLLRMLIANDAVSLTLYYLTSAYYSTTVP